MLASMITTENGSCLDVVVLIGSCSVKIYNVSNCLLCAPYSPMRKFLPISKPLFQTEDREYLNSVCCFSDYVLTAISNMSRRHSQWSFRVYPLIYARLGFSIPQRSQITMWTLFKTSRYSDIKLFSENFEQAAAVAARHQND